MNIALWIVQALLAVMFAMAGIIKSTQPIEKLAGRMPWVGRVSVTQVRIIGIAELLAAIGLIVPWLSGILPILTPISALGLVVIMILAIIHHQKHDGMKEIMFNLVLLLLAAFVAWGRYQANA